MLVPYISQGTTPAKAMEYPPDGVAADERVASSILLPTASSSMLEGLAETLTITEFAIGENLRKSISSSNPLENLQRELQRVARNVKRWRGGQMTLRCCVGEQLDFKWLNVASGGSRVTETCSR